MKQFSFDKIQARLEKKRNLKLSDQQNHENFLKLYQEIPPDIKIQEYCTSIKQEFDQKRKNSRYYSYQLPKKQQLSPAIQMRIAEIKKLGHYRLPFKGNHHTDHQHRNNQQKDQEMERVKQDANRTRNLLCVKFRNQVWIILGKMRKMKITMEDVVGKELFKQEPYRFGNQIFIATKEGNAEKVWRILIQNRLSIFSMDNTNKTALIWSCIRNHPKITRMLLQFGSEPTKKDINKMDALSYAIKYGSQQCTKLLLFELVNIEDHHIEDAKQAGHKLWNVVNIAKGVTESWRKMGYGERVDLFQQQVLYLSHR